MQLQPAIASPSLGHQTKHLIERRLHAASSHGFKLIELVEDDVTIYARSHHGAVTEDTMLQGARDIKALCDILNIKPCVLQPFWFYEGLLDRKEHEARLEKLRLWMKLVKILDVRLVQVPTNWMNEGTSGHMDTIVSDLIEMANIGLQQDPVVSFAYEAVAWGTHIDTWQGAWEVVQRVNKPNFGLCLDTYHIVARDWGDPTIPGCKRVDGDESLKRSLNELVTRVDVGKIFYVQLGDAEKLDYPLIRGHSFYNEDQLPRMSWSRNARLFAWENGRGGCLPLDGIVDTIFNKLKFDGLLSMETFSRELLEDDPDVPERFAARAKESWRETVKRIKK